MIVAVMLSSIRVKDAYSSKALSTDGWGVLLKSAVPQSGYDNGYEARVSEKMMNTALSLLCLLVMGQIAP
jgi:hypothetical protein